MNAPLDCFDFDRYVYEVAFEFRDSGFLRRMLTRKSDYLAYYIRRVKKTVLSTESKEEVLLSHAIYKGYEFHTRGYYDWKPLYWGNPGEPQDLLMRVHMKLRPSQDNVTFSTASLYRSVTP